MRDSASLHRRTQLVCEGVNHRLQAHQPIVSNIVSHSLLIEEISPTSEGILTYTLKLVREIEEALECSIRPVETIVH